MKIITEAMKDEYLKIEIFLIFSHFGAILELRSNFNPLTSRKGQLCFIKLGQAIG